MARLGFLALLLSALAAVSNAVPAEQQVALVAPGDWKWEDCGTWAVLSVCEPPLTGTSAGGPSHLIHIDDIQITPDPPQKGQEMTVTVKGTAKDRIEVGVLLSGVSGPVLTHSLNRMAHMSTLW